MRRRCRLPSQASYHLYGGRGIKVCERWNLFVNFLSDMGECPEGHSLDRINSNGNYEPGNCRWVPMTDQAKNKRNNRPLTFNGETKLLTEWAAAIGISWRTLRARLDDHKWPLERALTEAVRGSENASS